MFFLGTTFFGARNVIDPSPTKVKNINKITIKNGTYDNLFVSTNPELNVKAGYGDWDYDTILNANFEKTLDAGNSGFSLNTTDTILVKCRKKGTFDWITIYQKNVEVISDLSPHIKDYYRPSNTDFDYMVVSVCNGVSNAYITQEIRSEFDGFYICDQNNIYGTILDLDYMDTSIDTKGTKLDLLNNQYPTITNNSKSHYETGTIGGTFIQFNFNTNEIDIPSGIQYREDVKAWLDNKRPKIMKFYDGRIKLISVSGSISDTGDGHNDRRKIKFDWVEIGNVNDMETLYNKGLSDVGKEWWY